MAFSPLGDVGYITNRGPGVDPDTSTVTVFNTATNAIIATIPGFDTAFGIAFPDQTTPPPPPTSTLMDLQGACKTDCFLTQKDLIAVLTWCNPSLSTTSYRVLRNSELLETILVGSPRVYRDHNRQEGASYSYTVEAYENTTLITSETFTLECR